MKRLQVIAGIFLIVLMAGNTSLSAQRGMRGMRMDSVRSQRMYRMNMDSMRIGHRQDSIVNRFVRHGMRPMFNTPMWRAPMGRGIGATWGGPMGRGADSVIMGRMRRYPMGREGYYLENIPNLTEKQKAALEELRVKNQSEVKIFREETASKMKNMREIYSEKMMELLTPEQKKWVESIDSKLPKR